MLALSSCGDKTSIEPKPVDPVEQIDKTVEITAPSGTISFAIGQEPVIILEDGFVLDDL
jgi:hypothetical protein